MSQYLNEFKKIDELIRSGEIQIARKYLMHVDACELNENYATEFASLLRRVGDSSKGIKVLQKFIHSKDNYKYKNCSAGALLEYAACLVNNLSINESISILKELDSTKYHKVNLYMSFAKFYKWQHKEAIPLLEQYIKSDQITEYERLVGKVNLINACIHEKEIEKVELLVKEVEAVSINQNISWLKLNLQRFKAMNLFNMNRFEESLALFEKAYNSISEASVIEKFYSKRWIAILKLFLDPSQENIGKIKEIQKEAVTIGHFESVRDMDYYLCLKLKDQNLFNKLYFGTPHSEYKRRLKENADWAIVPNYYEYNITKSENEETTEINLATFLSEKPNLMKLFNLLIRDFYAHKNTQEIFEEIFIGECFNSKSSPNRVFQLVDRINDCFEKENIHMKIASENGKYKVVINKNYKFIFHYTLKKVCENEIFIKNIITKFGDKEFTIQELSLAMNLHARTLSHKIKKLVEARQLSKIGDGCKTRYAVKDMNVFF